MKLYHLNRGDRFRIVGEIITPPSHREVRSSEIFRLGHLDGMYSLCVSENDSDYVHLFGGTEVEVVDDD